MTNINSANYKGDISICCGCIPRTKIANRPQAEIRSMRQKCKILTHTLVSDLWVSIDVIHQCLRCGVWIKVYLLGSETKKKELIHH